MRTSKVEKQVEAGSPDWITGTFCAGCIFLLRNEKSYDSPGICERYAKLPCVSPAGKGCTLRTECAVTYTADLHGCQQTTL